MSLKQIKNSEFKKASFCGWAGSCVEVAVRADGVAVRSTCDPKKITLKFTSGEWTTFVKGVKAGEFDLS